MVGARLQYGGEQARGAAGRTCKLRGRGVCGALNAWRGRRGGCGMVGRGGAGRHRVHTSAILCEVAKQCTTGIEIRANMHSLPFHHRADSHPLTHSLWAPVCMGRNYPRYVQILSGLTILTIVSLGSEHLQSAAHGQRAGKQATRPHRCRAGWPTSRR